MTTEIHSVSAPTNWKVLVPSAVLIGAITLWGIAAPESAQNALGAVATWIADSFGWFYVLLGAAVLVFVIILAASRRGNERLGTSDSKPEFKTFTWAAMLFAAGIGTDLMFFAVAEPVAHYMAPPSGEAQTVLAAREAIAWTMFHYGIVGWAMYALMGVALGVVAYRFGRPLIVRSALYPLLGKKTDGPIGDAVDISTVLATIFGVATTLGIGVVMVNTGLNVVWGVPISIAVQFAIVGIGVLVATWSAVSGVKQGMRIISLVTLWLALGLTLWIIVAGNTRFLLDALVQNIGDFFYFFPGMLMQTFAYEDTGTWMADWTLFFWAWWVAWASFIGMFVARISRGRTIREVVIGTLVIPFSYIVMWVSVYGNAALDLIRTGSTDFSQTTLEDSATGFYTMLQQYPGEFFVAGLATVVALLFYVTSADSAALVMAGLTSREPDPNQDAPAGRRVFWAVMTGALTLAMLLVGGVAALQSATLIMGLPFAFVLVAVMFGLHRVLQRTPTPQESLEFTAPQP